MFPGNACGRRGPGADSVTAVPNSIRVHPAPRRRAAAAALAAAALAGAALAAHAEPAAAKVEIGVYQDDPLRGVPALRAAAGPKATRVISVYVTGGKTVDPRVIALAQRTKARLMVSWMPDAGKDGVRQPRYRLVRTIRGAQNRGLVALTKQLRNLRPAPILRPMPEPNTTWYAWSGTVNRNTPAAYVSAWKKVRATVRKAGGKRILFLWAPYARSVPDTPGERDRRVLPGRRAGQPGGDERLQLRERRRARLDRGGRPVRGRLPPDLGARAEALLDRRDRLQRGRRQPRAVDRQAPGLPTSIPNLAGVVWFDVRDRNGDFRISTRRASRAAFAAFARRAGR